MAATKSAFAFLLLAAIVVTSDAIQCHRCNDCADRGKLESATDCIKVEYPPKAQSFFDNIPGLKDAVGGVINTFNQATAAVVKSCYKMVAKEDGKETVYRGCSAQEPSADPECKTKGDNEMCIYVCEGDGCNSSPTIHMPGAIIMTCLLIIFTFVVV